MAAGPAAMGKKKKEGLHPTDVFRKQERKKEIKKSKFQKAQVCRRTHARTHAAREPCETLTGGWRARAGR